MYPATGSETGKFNLSLAARVWLWNEQTQLGVAFDSSSGFELPNGAIRSPDVSWVQIDRWNALTPEQQRKFAPIAPDFVIELMSANDLLSDTQEKMQEYVENKEIIEILYKLRNVLFHGEIVTDNNTNKVYEPAYHILYTLIQAL